MKLLLFLTIAFLMPSCQNKQTTPTKDELAAKLHAILDITDKGKYTSTINSLSVEELISLTEMATKKLIQKRLELRKRADYLAKIISEVTTKLDDDSSSSEKTDNEALTWEEYHKKKSKENSGEAFIPWDETVKKLTEDMKNLEKLKQQKNEEKGLP